MFIKVVQYLADIQEHADGKFKKHYSYDKKLMKTVACYTYHYPYRTATVAHLNSY